MLGTACCFGLPDVCSYSVLIICLYSDFRHLPATR